MPAGATAPKPGGEAQQGPAEAPEESRSVTESSKSVTKRSQPGETSPANVPATPVPEETPANDVVTAAIEPRTYSLRQLFRGLR